MLSPAAHGSPQGATVTAGAATIASNGTTTNIVQSTPRAVIDWRAFGVDVGESVIFSQPSRSSATLNRVTGEQVSTILGRIDANGQVVLVNPNGIVFGAGGQVNVGSLIASTANIGNANFMAGRLVFDQPGKPGAGIANAGTISVAEGGLVALVAPHVRNDGLIRARLGKVVLGAGDTFTLDLYGDGLINLAVSEDQVKQMRDAQGNPVAALVAHAGKIEADGAEVMLVSVAAAKSALDRVINLSGTIQADTVHQQEGRIVLLGRGGAVDVTGSLTATGKAPGQTGGRIDVLGDRLVLGSTAELDASGAGGGGKIQVGGAFQGKGDTYRADTTRVAAGARMRADATQAGDGGEVIVWSSGHTSYAGDIVARGGPARGNGGVVEVSGKQTLDYQGTVDASAAQGRNGSLLLDPATLDIGTSEAALVSRVLRTGTSTSIAADVDINVNAVIDGRGRRAGGGLTLTAGNDINVNDFIVTNNGAINLVAAGGTVNVAPDKGVFAGTAPITVRSGGDLSTRPMMTTGLLTLASARGSVFVDTAIDGTSGAVDIDAAADVNVNQPVLNMRSGNALRVNAGNDINVNAPVDGRDGVPGGAVSLTAGHNVRLNESVTTANGAIDVVARTGTLTAGKDQGLFAGNGPIGVTTGATYSVGTLVTTGALNLRSTSGALDVDTPISETTGAVTLSSATAVNVNQPIVNLKTGANVSITAGTDINVRAQIDGRDGTAAGGAVTMVAGNDIAVDNNIVTRDGAIDLTATRGTIRIASGKQIRAGSAPLSVTTGGDFSTGAAPPEIPPPGADVKTLEQANAYVREFLRQFVTLVTTGPITIRSTAGNVNVDAPISDASGAVTLSAGNAINVNQKVNSANAPITLNAGPGGIVVKAVSDSCGGLCADAAEIDPMYADLTLNSIGNIIINDSIATARTLTIDTRGQFVTGAVSDSQAIVPGTTQKKVRPDRIVVRADGGIVSMGAGIAGEIDATSANGSINIFVELPRTLRLTTLSPTGDIRTGGFVGDIVDLNAGGNLNLYSLQGGSIRLTSGRDTNLDGVVARDLTVSAGNNANLNVVVDSTMWIGTGSLAVSARNDIDAIEPIHMGSDNSLTLSAGRNLTTRILETLGPITLVASTGNMNLNNDIGPHYAPTSKFNFGDKAVASLVLSAPATTPGNGNIDMQGARAEGAISIIAGGRLTAAKDITSTQGDGAITIAAANANSIAALRPLPKIGSQGDVPPRGPVLPAIFPGPTVPPPVAPLGVSAASPGLPEIPVAGSLLPPGSGTSRIDSTNLASLEQSVAEAATLPETTASEEAQEAAQADESRATIDCVELRMSGRGAARSVDGRGAKASSTADTSAATKACDDERRKRERKR